MIADRQTHARTHAHKDTLIAILRCAIGGGVTNANQGAYVGDGDFRGGRGQYPIAASLMPRAFAANIKCTTAKHAARQAHRHTFTDTENGTDRQTDTRPFA